MTVDTLFQTLLICLDVTDTRLYSTRFPTYLTYSCVPSRRITTRKVWGQVDKSSNWNHYMSC